MTPVTHRVESAGLSAAFDARRGSGEGSVARLPYLVLAGRDHTGTCTGRLTQPDQVGVQASKADAHTQHARCHLD